MITIWDGWIIIAGAEIGYIIGWYHSKKFHKNTLTQEGSP